MNKDKKTDPMTQEREQKILEQYVERAGQESVKRLAELVSLELAQALIAGDEDGAMDSLGRLMVVLDALALSLDADTTAAEIATLEMMEEALRGDE